MALFLNKNLVFIDSMQFMNSSIDKLVKNLWDEDFKCLVEEFGSENLELLKQKGDYPYEYMNSFERFNEEKLPARKYFYSSIKDGKIGDDGKISDGHISFKDYLTCEKICDKFKIKNIGDYHDHYLKRCIVISRCFWKVYCYGAKILWAWSLSFFQFSWIKLGCYVKNDWCKISKNIWYWQVVIYWKGIERRISYIAKRFIKFILYLDMNNLYGLVISEYPPYEGFE